MTQQLDELYARLDLVGTKLSHSGVKGMKWGVRRSDAQLAKASSSTSTKLRNAAAATGRGVKSGAKAVGNKVVNKKPEPPPDSVDAVRARETMSAIRTKQSLSAVSDSDLNHLVNRINLEKRFAEVNPKAGAKGHKAIKSALSVGTTMNEAIKFLNSPAGRLLSSGLGLSKSAGKHAKPMSEVLKAANKKK